MSFTVTKYLNLSLIKPFPKSIDDFVTILQELIKILQENEFSSSKNIRLIELLSERHMKRTISKSSLTDFQLILCVPLKFILQKPIQFFSSFYNCCAIAESALSRNSSTKICTAGVIKKKCTRHENMLRCYKQLLRQKAEISAKQ